MIQIEKLLNAGKVLIGILALLIPFAMAAYLISPENVESSESMKEVYTLVIAAWICMAGTRDILLEFSRFLKKLVAEMEKEHPEEENEEE